MEYISGLVSVIIPVYNVEKYLDRCITTVVNQTYSNIEIIIVDDGSTDKSGELCRKWSLSDDRIVLISKENGGLSSARNKGLDVARGEYVYFIDSDDWIADTTIEDLVDAIEKYRVDVVCYGMFSAQDDYINEMPWYSEWRCIGKEKALELLIENKVLTSHVVSKLYSKKLFTEIRFPENKLFEDIRIMHHVFMACNSILIIPNYYYYYYVRSDSISHTVRLKNKLEWIYALEQRYNDLADAGYAHIDIIKAQIAIVISLSMIQNKFSSEEIKYHQQELKKIKKMLKNKNICVIVKKYANKSQYIYYLLARLFMQNGNKLYSIIRK